MHQANIEDENFNEVPLETDIESNIEIIYEDAPEASGQKEKQSEVRTCQVII